MVSNSKKVIRYAVVGLGHIAQAAVLPAFAHATHNSVLTALVSNDTSKLKKLARYYKVPHLYHYDEYQQCLTDGHIDAVYIALPNSMHSEYAVRAAEAGIHVLCEKPMAVSTRECQAMIRTADAAKVKLMIAYRLHFDEATLRANDIAQSGQLGSVRLLHAVFTLQVCDDNIRLRQDLGGGALFDIGIYCINAARMVFRSNPMEVTGYLAQGGDARFTEVDESAVGILRFPEDRLATFACSFGASERSAYEIIGTKGHLRVDPAYEYEGRLKHVVTIDGAPQTQLFPSGDQFAPQLIYFSDCVLNGKEPEPSGTEGLMDVHILEAIVQSATSGQSVKLDLSEKRQWPSLRQAIHRPPVRKPFLVNVASSSK